MAKCDRLKCASGKPAVWSPVLVLTAIAGTEPARATLIMSLCDDCRDTMVLGDFVTDANWPTVEGIFDRERKRRPQRSLTVLDWVLTDGEPEALR